jgi:hypothetical protein
MILPSQLAPPVTETAGYFEAPAPALAEWLVDGLGRPWTSRACSAGTLEELVALLEPRVPLSRYLLVPNRTWTVILNNGPGGTDLGVLPWQSTRDLGCRAVGATAALAESNLYPATMLELYDPGVTDNPLFCRRTIVAADDGGRWTFSETGERFAFEDPSAYRRRLIRDRFTPEMLARYLFELGVPAHEKPDTLSAILVEQP